MRPIVLVLSVGLFTSDGQPAAYVTVLVKDTSKGTFADADGKFEFKKIKTGNYILLVSLSGYAPTEIYAEVKQNEAAILRIQLQLTYTELLDVTVRSGRGNFGETKASEGTADALQTRKHCKSNKRKDRLMLPEKPASYQSYIAFN